MSLHKKCRSCSSFFPAKVRSLEILCDKLECQEKKNYYLDGIKGDRYVPMDYFDIYDLDRPSKHCYTGYERVCRYCGNPLLRKDGKYSVHMRYCQEHRGKGYELFNSFNWSSTSKSYAFHVQAQFKKEIREKIKESNIELKNRIEFVICEECHELCLIFDLYMPRFKGINVINVHHKEPVHTLNWDNLYLIWDFNNLICLCPKCHNKQDHKLKKKEDMIKKSNFVRISKWL